MPNQCVYVVTGQWTGGFTAAVRITNRRSVAIDGWNVLWSYPDSSKVTGAWNAQLSGTNPYRAVNQSYNRTIMPGATVEFGMQGSMPGNQAATPVVSGAACE